MHHLCMTGGCPCRSLFQPKLFGRDWPRSSSIWEAPPRLQVRPACHEGGYADIIGLGVEELLQTVTEGRYEPLHPNHAIEQVVVQVGFTREMSDSEFVVPIWQKVHARVRDRLPAFQPESGIRIDTGVIPPRARPGTTAFNFASLLPDGTAGLALRIERGLLAFASTSYSRWHAFMGEALAVIQPVLKEDIWPLGIRISSAGIAYNNRFLWNGPHNRARASRLIRPSSKWVVPRVYEVEQNWHSYTGAFERSSPTTNRLVVVNLDAVTGLMNDVETKSVGLTLNLTENIQPDSAPKPEHGSAEEALAWIHGVVERLHTAEKQVIAEILTDEMQHRIGLWAEVSV